MLVLLYIIMLSSRRTRAASKKKKAKIPRSYNLPLDILLSILVRLPAVSLQRLKCVSKQWLEFIRDPGFAEAHYTVAAAQSFGLIFTRFTASHYENIYLETTRDKRVSRQFADPDHTDDDDVDYDFAGLIFGEKPTIRRRSSSWHQDFTTQKKNIMQKVYGSCKGLILIGRSKWRDQQTVLLVANPVTGDSRRLPRFRHGSGSLSSASIVPSNGAQCKVVALWYKYGSTPTTNTKPLICGILTIGDHTKPPAWRELSFPAQIRQVHGAPVLARGALHWTFKTGILPLDLAREEFHQTAVRFCSYYQLTYESYLLEWDGFLAVIPTNGSPLKHAWILKDSDVWKPLDISIDITFFKRLCPYEKFFFIHQPYPIASLRDGKIIIFRKATETYNHFFAYDVGRQVMKQFGVAELCETSMKPFRNKYLGKHEIGYIIPHVNSLLSC